MVYWTGVWVFFVFKILHLHSYFYYTCPTYFLMNLVNQAVTKDAVNVHINKSGLCLSHKLKTSHSLKTQSVSVLMPLVW